MAISKSKNTVSNTQKAVTKRKIPVVNPQHEQFVSVASSSSRTSYRGETAKSAKLSSLLKNIDNGVTPYELSDGCISVRDAILLTQKAYFNVAVFRHTIDIQTEFANSKIHLKGGSAKTRKFFKSWFEKIKLHNLGEQFFREWYRSSNFFCLKVNHSIDENDIKSIKESYSGPVLNSLLGKNIPLRYVVLNPADVKVSNSLFGESDSEYFKFLNSYERKRLEKPSTEEEKRFLKSLPPDIQLSIKNRSPEIKIKLSSDNFIAVFAKKQDYEAMSVPMYFPVLFDINLKLELKKVEQEIAKTIDYVVFLVTNGDKDNGVDQRVFTELKNLLTSESVGRVLVADYTTKAEFIIPDLNKILGPEKYEAVNRDISNGLMNIFFEDQKFSNSFVKIKVFLERLEESRLSFLNKFLIPEMEKIAKELSFDSLPTPYFEEINLDEHASMSKIYTRLYELGFLTAQDYLEVAETGSLPTYESLLENQKSFTKFKDDGLFAPLNNSFDQQAGRPEGAKAPQTTKKVSPQKSVGSSFSVAGIKSSSSDITKLIEDVEVFYKEQKNIKRLNSKNKEICYSLASQIIINEKKEDWKPKIIDYYNGKGLGIITDQNRTIKELSDEHLIDEMGAAILFHSK